MKKAHEVSVSFEEGCFSVSTGRSSRRLTFSEVADGWRQHVLGNPLTQHVAEFTDNFSNDGMPEEKAFLFVRLVCAWGGLGRGNPERIRRSIFDPVGMNDRGAKWLRCVLGKGRQASINGAYETAIQAFDDIDGLGISFRSKILRFLAPDDAAVLDSVIRKELGYRHNLAGYREFVTDCKAIRDQLKHVSKRPDGDDWRTSDVEMGIYMIVKLSV